jgi:type I restriction-modification system DNA methylase subunit
MVNEMNGIKLLKSDQVAIAQFTADMDRVIEELADNLKETFEVFREGKCGENIKTVTLQLFDEWLVRNLLPRIEDIVKVTAKEIRKTASFEEIRTKLAKKLAPFRGVDSYVVNVMAEIKKGDSAEDSARKHIWEIYYVQRENFLVQTATLLVGRILMHLVGVDKKAWSETVVQSGPANPYLDFYWNLRRGMNEYLPSVYALNELDWLYVSDIERQGLNKENLDVLNQYEAELDKDLGRAHDMLKRYDFELVDLDIWKKVYQGFLSREDINRLGFVTTPDEIVDLILDLASYSEEKNDLCKTKVLDPACGSGTFLVEALSRLRKHLEADMPCHKKERGLPDWAVQKKILETILYNINGIDINPFAAFLTTMNLTFQLIDIYSRVKHKYVDFSLSFNVATHDSLAKKPAVQEIDPRLNSRVREAVNRSRRYSELCDRKFNLVVGNPPWGAVLRGAIGPLGDENQRKFYKEEYKGTAVGKYDYYVLFMDRGIRWLEGSGTLAMITQVTYISQAFGEGIKRKIRSETCFEIFVDISNLGPLIFPNYVNYPAITVLRKSCKQKDVMLVEVKEVE